MNAPPLNPSADHLDGTVLEALAAGAAREDERAHAQSHLDACARCRAELAAMQAESTHFAAYFSDEEKALLQGKRPAFEARSRFRRAAVWASLAALAAAILVGATVFLHPPEQKAQSRSFAEEGKPKKDTPEPPGPPEPPKPAPVPTVRTHVSSSSSGSTGTVGLGEATYGGHTTSEWLEVLNAGDQNTRPKAMHALTKLGADAIPALLKQMREGNDAQKKDASMIMSDIEVGKATPQLLQLLSDPDWSVRQTVVQMLKSLAIDNAEVARRLEGMLGDRDKAVVEAAEEALKAVRERDMAQKAKIEDLNVAAKEAVPKGDYNTAANALKELIRVMPTNAQYAQMLADVAELQRRDQTIKVNLDKAQVLVQERRWDEAAKLLDECSMLDPKNVRVKSLWAVLQDGKKIDKMRMEMRESDLPGPTSPKNKDTAP